MGHLHGLVRQSRRKCDADVLIVGGPDDRISEVRTSSAQEIACCGKRASFGWQWRSAAGKLEPKPGLPA